jgi:4'-phosphopantetheinyl transferase
VDWLKNISLGAGFVDVWSVDLSFDELDLQGFYQTLSSFERTKLLAFKQKLLANRYLAVRGVLRRILADYLKVEPGVLQFEVSPFGKPYLKHSPLFFNISHSGDCLLIAISDFDQIGIDLELIKSRANLLGLAKRCFSLSELNFWLNLPVDAQQQAFYRLWVRKEAFVKAVGRGIVLGLNQCELCLPDLNRFVTIPDGFGCSDDWVIADLQVADVVAALVVPNRCLVLNQYCFEL